MHIIMMRIRESLAATDALANHQASNRRVRSAAVLATLVASSLALVGCGESRVNDQAPVQLGTESAVAYGFITGSSVSKQYLGLFGPKMSTVYLDVCEDSQEIPSSWQDSATREAVLESIEDCPKEPASVTFEGVSAMQDITGAMVRVEVTEGQNGETNTVHLVPYRYPDANS